MRTAFLRAPAAPDADRPAPGHGVLDAYTDLTADQGPLHARSVADAGRRLLAGDPVPPYQINTPSVLRRHLALESPGGRTAVRDPREIPAGARSAAWALLCDSVEADAWPGLPEATRVDVAAVLSKLGFWDTVLDLVPADLPATASPAHARLAYFRRNAEVKAHGATPETFDRARTVLEAIAEAEPGPGTHGFPLPNRLGAAVNLIVHHAKSDRSVPRMRRWSDLAASLVERAGPGGIGPVQLSLYWRGVSFLPFFAGDHRAVRDMLDRAEDEGRRARDTATDDESRLLADENRHPLLETRGRAARAAGDPDTAEEYYRALVAHDPYDAKTHVRLADHLLGLDRPREARDHYRDAAVLGAPYTAYAHTQAARCCLRLDERDAALASLTHAVRADPCAVTPLVLLRDLLPGTPFASLLPWTRERLDALLTPLRKADR